MTNLTDCTRGYPIDEEYLREFRNCSSVMLGWKVGSRIWHDEEEWANRAWWARRGSLLDVEATLLKILFAQFAASPFLTSDAEFHCRNIMHPAFVRAVVFDLAKREVLMRKHRPHTGPQKYYISPGAIETLNKVDLSTGSQE